MIACDRMAEAFGVALELSLIHISSGFIEALTHGLSADGLSLSYQQRMLSLIHISYRYSV